MLHRHRRGAVIRREDHRPLIFAIQLVEKMCELLVELEDLVPRFERFVTPTVTDVIVRGEADDEKSRVLVIERGEGRREHDFVAERHREDRVEVLRLVRKRRTDDALLADLAGAIVVGVRRGCRPRCELHRR